jgi:ComF family protein
LPFESRRGADHRCADCITRPKLFGIARAPLVYDQIAMSLIQRFKYNGKLQLARPLAELLLTAFRRFWEPDRIDTIVPVPLHIARFRSRGFNQSYLMVNHWNKIAGGVHNSANGHQIERELLVRSRATLPQTSLGRKQRAVNIKDAFALRETFNIEGKHILLIDDVYTTGATANECARVLVDGGAGQVDVLTLARAV